MRLAVLACLALIAAAARADDGVVRLHAAGSLRPALTEVAQAFTAAHGIRVEAAFGSSGTLRERLAGGEAGGVYASADMGNPLALARDGKAWPVVTFVRNRLCAIARPGLAVSPDTLLDAMLAPGTKLGTSTPRSDPAGDYALQVFAKAGALRPGAEAVLRGKSIRLTGAPDSPPPPPGRNTYGWHIMEGRADLFLAYCTAARDAVAEAPSLQAVDLPPDLAVGAEYGLTAMRAADPGTALPLVLFILSPEGQAILSRHGFDAPLAPR